MDSRSIALNRFGLGARPGEAVSGDPMVWLKDQLLRYQPGLPGAAQLASRAAIADDIAAYREMVRDGKQAAAAAPAPAPTMQGVDAAKPAKPPAQIEARQFARDQHILQVGLRTRSAVESNSPFAERLVHFWANHFAVSADKLVTIALSGLLEFEAIRPHVLGRFEDMLVAVEQHPAMLLYLDQAQSVGPDSPLGQRAGQNGRKVGLNENLGREILELHTLGVRTGYSQTDVTEFARALTGWTVAGLGRGPVQRLLEQGASPGQTVFAGFMHQPGKRTILGKSYGQDGAAQARAVLADLARNPATAHHLATKLARHFVADDPPPALVARLEAAWQASDGDLPTVYRALIDASESWQAQPQKFRTPWQWGVAMFRGLTGKQGDPAAKIPDRALTGMFAELGQPVWRPGSPAGFDDVAASWAAPDALYRRVELAGRVAQQASAAVDPRALATAVLGDGLSAPTAEAISRADSPQQGLALLLVAPEMLRC